MQLAVISDLHLGRRGLTDGFGHDDAEFLGFLTFLEDNFERVVLLGDIWETLTGALPGDQAGELKAAQEAHPELAARFKRPKYLHVHGNHDLVSRHFGVPEEITLRADGVRLLFTHGHQGDPLVAERQGASEFGVWLGGWLRRLHLGAVYRLANELDTMRGGFSLDATRCSFQRAWMGRAANRDVDVMVTGHTHLATRAEHGNRLYLNSGSCSEGQLSYLAIDTRRGNYSVNTGF
ncbi:MAG TPA: metallophosphoesterase family protein [Polyangiaceae bacterium]|nr:metallophosphoesterase family protein [Polyangiaceae bacterium]